MIQINLQIQLSIYNFQGIFFVHLQYSQVPNTLRKILHYIQATKNSISTSKEQNGNELVISKHFSFLIKTN